MTGRSIIRTLRAKELGASMHRVLFAVLVVIGALSAGCRASPPEIEDFELDPRPNDRVPLAAQIAFRTNRPTTVALEFDDGERRWTVDIGGGATTTHVVPILGMRPDRTHVVRAVVTGENGVTNASEPFVSHNGSTPRRFPPSRCSSQCAGSNGARHHDVGADVPVGRWK